MPGRGGDPACGRFVKRPYGRNRGNRVMPGVGSRGSLRQRRAEDLPKSFVVCRAKGEETRVYLSQLNSATLLKRSESAALE